MRIRKEEIRDLPAIHRVNQLAFGSDAEASLVDVIRTDAGSVISLVAEDLGEIVGHIMFSPVTVDHDHRFIMGLAPLSVTPARQRQGIGSELVSAGLDECRALGAAGAVVVGHAAFYPRFGFVPASRFGLSCEFEVPDDVFMAVEFVDNAFGNAGGLIRYHPAFSA
jgi:putative acetyltransferase